MSRPEGVRDKRRYTDEDDPEEEEEYEQETNASTSDDDDDDSDSSSSSSETTDYTTNSDSGDSDDDDDDSSNHKQSDSKTQQQLDGDEYDVIEGLKLCISNNKADVNLVQVCGANSRAWKHSDIAGPLPKLHPHEPYKYNVDINPDIMKPLNGDAKNWLAAVSDPLRGCYRSQPPIPVHLATKVHQLKLTFNLPGGDYQDLPEVCKTILRESKKGYINLTLSPDQKQQLFKILGDTIEHSSSSSSSSSSRKGNYHMFIRAIAITDRSNRLPITFGGMLITRDPLTRKDKNWCNVKHISNSRSSTFQGTCAATIPSNATQCDIIEHIWVSPTENYHPDVSRFMNVNFKHLRRQVEEMKLTGTARKVALGPDPKDPATDPRLTYSVYEVKMPELSSTKADNMIQFIVWERMADIVLRTKALPDITAKQIRSFTDYDYTLKGYRLLCVVLDSIIQEYEPYTRHRNYLMSLDGEVTFALLPERPLNEVEQDIANFRKDPKAQHYGPGPSVTLQIEYETFGNSANLIKHKSSSSSNGTAVVTAEKSKEKEKNKKNKKKSKSKHKDKEKEKEKDKEKQKSKTKSKSKPKSNKKSLLKGINSSSQSASIKVPRNRKDYMPAPVQTTATTTSTLLETANNNPGALTSATVQPQQPQQQTINSRFPTSTSRNKLTQSIKNQVPVLTH